jgi:hypothetical protein
MATPVTIGGRIVWASGASPLDQSEVIDTRTKQPKLNPDGTKVLERGFGLAIPKTDPRFAALWAAMTAEAAKVCNGHVPPFPSDQFAYKLIDGDGMDKGDIARGRQPQPYNKREGYGGCWVITIKSQLPNPPPVFDWINNNWQQVDPNNIRGGNKLKVGDFVDVGLNVDGHAGQSPGLYLNPQGIQFLGFGTAILRGPDAATMFGAGPGQLPAGASASPVGGPANAAPPAMPGATPPVPGNSPAMPGSTPPTPGAPAAAPLPGNSAATPGNLPGMGNASPSSPPAGPGQAPPMTGFHAGAPGQAPAPAAAPPAAPPTPPARVQAGVDAAGRPYFFKVGNSGETEY